MKITRQRAFTLVEALVVLLVVGVLVAILLPALRIAKIHADRVSDLADLKSHVAAVSMYTIDSHDAFPLFIDPQSGNGMVPGVAGVEISYFDQVVFWPFPLLSNYYPDLQEHHGEVALGEEFYLKSAEGDLEYGALGHNPSYIYGATFISKPAYWDAASRQPPPAQLGAVHTGEVRFPSAKALFDVPTIDGFLSVSTLVDESREKVLVLTGLVDGSADAFRADEIAVGYPTGPGFYQPWADGGYLATRCAYTQKGVEGIDILSR